MFALETPISLNDEYRRPQGDAIKRNKARLPKSLSLSQFVEIIKQVFWHVYISWCAAERNAGKFCKTYINEK